MRSGGGGGGGDCDQRCRRRGKCVWAFVPCLTVRPASFCPGGGLHDDVCRNLVGALVRTLLDFWEKRQESRFTTQRERETEGSAGSGQEPPACFLGNKKNKNTYEGTRSFILYIEYKSFDTFWILSIPFRNAQALSVFPSPPPLSTACVHFLPSSPSSPWFTLVHSSPCLLACSAESCHKGVEFLDKLFALEGLPDGVERVLDDVLAVELRVDGPQRLVQVPDLPRRVQHDLDPRGRVQVVQLVAVRGEAAEGTPLPVRRRRPQRTLLLPCWVDGRADVLE
mmetsp:Transcript_5398/g.13510  ORF Transcript_5398/g.13510 Transcript_5398/m.13510 type:complete len:281 (-) Transcript_5398:162-1004(-)